MSIRLPFPLDADGGRTFSFERSDDHYRLEVLSYVVSFPLLLRSVMIIGCASWFGLQAKMHAFSLG